MPANIINQLGFVMEMRRVFLDTGSEYLNFMQAKLTL